ncbi:hypothetical protein M2344_000648 [Sphingobium sp. B8D3C]|nr:hypothetical protein [Sphingobium sp. B8D3B]MCW2417686.1 hypothetical protein [Sphingobium sp. B8D3C]
MPNRFQGADIADRPYLAKLKARLKRLVNAGTESYRRARRAYRSR